ncbi:hypothetical protein [Rathayibacter toxicus]|uniref:Uncharacterized protein n=1 Tax=Rathayibacter toxicus TaxID=145458 RepID=A0A0C5B8C4_9MICO|nr:hypothetical protein [Rathayibacter toxicus]AJM76993.1 hypothetical protein TI83_01445 [Rathayibacter toxicus]ALS57213.1 hypothetical protein APU90_05045 [Rathayibacter toxicus]KKM47256.1 hypothetical protein VT73_00780 [Rathayibacter toxicus]PPG24068.1 hypothetical protein C5D15_01225 [Rathayibacter toxicus]PPH25318.1 hypothetical protein C5D17_01200 [Rathayibacter toxicus]
MHNSCLSTRAPKATSSSTRALPPLHINNTDSYGIIEIGLSAEFPDRFGRETASGLVAVPDAVGAVRILLAQW